MASLNKITNWMRLVFVNLKQMKFEKWRHKVHGGALNLATMAAGRRRMKILRKMMKEMSRRGENDGNRQLERATSIRSNVIIFILSLLRGSLVEITWLLIKFHSFSFISAHQWSIFIKLIWTCRKLSLKLFEFSRHFRWNSHGNERQASANWCHSFGTFPPKKYSNNLTAFQNGWNTFVPRSGLIDMPKWFSLKVHQHCQIHFLNELNGNELENSLCHRWDSISKKHS